MHLFELEVKNRVVRKGLNIFRIKGTQGTWYTEILYYLADSEEEAKEFATEEIKRRRMLGIPINTKRSLRREIKILNIRRYTVYCSPFVKQRLSWNYQSKNEKK